MFLNDFGFITSIKAKPLMLIRAYTDIGTFDLSMSVNERKKEHISTSFCEVANTFTWQIDELDKHIDLKRGPKTRNCIYPYYLFIYLFVVFIFITSTWLELFNFYKGNYDI